MSDFSWIFQDRTRMEVLRIDEGGQAGGMIGKLGATGEGGWWRVRVRGWDGGEVEKA